MQKNGETKVYSGKNSEFFVNSGKIQLIHSEYTKKIGNSKLSREKDREFNVFTPNRQRIRETKNDCKVNLRNTK